MLRRAAALIVPCLIAGCAMAPTVRAVRADVDGVTYEFPAGHQDEARRQAMLYCANLGRAAAMEETRPAPDGLAIAAYKCR
jgi:hypothetical protein